MRLTGNPYNLLLLVYRHGINIRYTGRLIFYLLKALLFLPLNFFESIGWSKKYRKTPFSKPPVFIIGHHRSGTTLLHKLLTSDKNFCFFKNKDIIFPRTNLPGQNIVSKILSIIITALKIKTFAYNNVLFNLEDPQEEDMCLVGMYELENFYWTFVFPKTFSFNHENIGIKGWKDSYIFHLKRIQYCNKGKTLLLKNPPNTARICELTKLFPGSKYIYIHRNPRDVIYSSVRLWKKGLDAFSLQSYNDETIKEKVLNYYRYFNISYRNNKDKIDPKNIIEINYDDLKKEPFAVIQKIYTQFKWDFQSVGPAVAKLIEKESNYKPFDYEIDPQLEKLIDKLNERLNSLQPINQ